jgi:hypothetical protein
MNDIWQRRASVHRHDAAVRKAWSETHSIDLEAHGTRTGRRLLQKFADGMRALRSIA